MSWRRPCAGEGVEGARWLRISDLWRQYLYAMFGSEVVHSNMASL